jgi:hypothetical protein
MKLPERRHDGHLDRTRATQLWHHDVVRPKRLQWHFAQPEDAPACGLEQAGLASIHILFHAMPARAVELDRKSAPRHQDVDVIDAVGEPNLVLARIEAQKRSEFEGKEDLDSRAWHQGAVWTSRQTAGDARDDSVPLVPARAGPPCLSARPRQNVARGKSAVLRRVPEPRIQR